jgi:hypothetical protein
MFKLDFKAGPVIPGVTASPVIVEPVQCAPDGMPFLDFPSIPDFKTHVIYGLDPEGARSFSTKSIKGLYDVTFQGFFPSDSIVGLLVNATEDSKQSQYVVRSADGRETGAGTGYKGEHRDYIVEFDRQGNYKTTIQLSRDYHFWRVMALPDGDLVALAYDRGNAEARLFLLGAGGEVIRALAMPAKMEDTPALREGRSGPDLNRARAESSLSSYYLVRSGQRVLLYRAHSTAPLLEVGAGGFIREVPLSAPEGYELDGLVAGEERWIVRYRRKGISGTGEIDARPSAGNFVLYEVSPRDGSLMRRMDPGTGPLFNIACEQDGVITAFSMNQDKVVKMAADAPR